MIVLPVFVLYTICFCVWPTLDRYTISHISCNTEDTYGKPSTVANNITFAFDFSYLPYKYKCCLSSYWLKAKYRSRPNKRPGRFRNYFSGAPGRLAVLLINYYLKVGALSGNNGEGRLLEQGR